MNIVKLQDIKYTEIPCILILEIMSQGPTQALFEIDGIRVAATGS